MEAEESATKTKEEMESDITKAMLARLPDFKKQADNLTLEGVRRALEKDMGMERLSLDAHKKFIKQCLEKYFCEDDAKNTSETEGKIAEDPVQQAKEGPQTGGRSSEFNDKLKGSPASGELQPAERETANSHGSCGPASEINEETIRKALRKRAAYFRSNLQITLVKVRRLLEEDLKLEEKSLDAYKKFISNELDAILESSGPVQATNGSKEELEKSSDRKSREKTSKGAKKVSKDSDGSDSDDIVSEEEEDEETRRPKKRPAQKIKADKKVMKKQKISTERSKVSGTRKKKTVEEDSEKSDGESSEDRFQSSEEEEEEDEETRRPKKRPTQKIKAEKKVLKKQKISTERIKVSGTGRKKTVEEDSEKSEGSGDGESSEDRSQSSDEEEEVKKKAEKPAQVYGKQVEHLKSIIKSCGIGIPPTVYKRVKQAPESKREARLIKELEEILEKEGLSTDPSEKEIKAVKKRKQQAKELEGIDMSNIVSSSRRRTASSFIPPPKPKIESESEDSGGENEDDEDNEEDSEEDDNDGEDSSEGFDGDDAEEESD